MSALETAWRGAQLRAKLGQELQRAELTTQRLQVQLTAHCWLHEDALALGSVQVNLPAPPISEYNTLHATISKHPFYYTVHQNSLKKSVCTIEDYNNFVFVSITSRG